MAMFLRNLWRQSFSKNNRQVVFVSGCDSGLGFSLARRCQLEGLTVVAGCLESLSPGAKELTSLGAKVVKLDVTKRETAAEAANFVDNLLKGNDFKLQAVVNNAALMVFGEFEWQTPRLMEEQVAVNLQGYFNVTYEFLPLLRAHKGRLMNIVSHCALAGLPGLSVYGATKAAILNWNDTMRIEQKKYGIKVVAIIPGSFFGQSNIMARQSQFAAEMFQGMTSKRRQFHEEYFHVFQNYIAAIPTPNEPQPLSDEKLYQKLMHGLLSPNPKHVYKHEPLRYAFYHTLFQIVPTNVRDYLIKQFTKLPRYSIKK